MSTRPLSATFNRQSQKRDMVISRAKSKQLFRLRASSSISEALGAFLSSAPTTNPRRRDDESMYGGETAVPGGNLARMDSYASARPSGRYHQNPFYTFPAQILPFEDNSPLYRRGTARGAPSVYDAPGYGARDPYRAGMQGDVSKFPTISLSTTSHRLAPSPPQAVIRTQTLPNSCILRTPVPIGAPGTLERSGGLSPLRSFTGNYHPLQQVPPAPTCLSTNRLLNRTPGVLQLPIHHLQPSQQLPAHAASAPALIIQGRGHHLERRALSDVLVLGAGLATTAGSTNRPQAQHLYPPP
ncbi:hypothetical protein D9611_014883 [Ephemerocybe angulata]|uniref:Uncharacterized protein n=1 Tax=Ephemerocybe angulata TaxID=980116 RepID=A0A8H5FEC6_9AGAR|nr:hypothetical protein D9611_014883 [Tulosesus angulatus]